MNLKNLNFGKTAALALVLVIAMMIVTFVFGTYLGSAPQTFYSTVNIPGIGSVNLNIPQTYTPVSDSIGNQIALWITGMGIGIPPFGALFTMFISAFVVVLLGGLLVSWAKIPTFAGKTGKLATVLIVGSIIPYLYFVGAVMPSFGLMGFVGLMIYTFIAAWATAFIAGLLKIDID